MGLLLRSVFWLSLVVLLLPTASPQHNERSLVSAVEAVSGTAAALADMRQFCARQPDACAVGSQALAQFGLKAQSGAKNLNELLNDRLGAEQGASVAAASSDKAGRPSNAKASQHTLTPADLLPPWRGLAPRRETKHPA